MKMPHAETGPGRTLALKLAPSCKTGHDVASAVPICSAICRAAATYKRLAEALCNGELTPAEERRAERAEERICELCEALPIMRGGGRPSPVFQNDPRGSTVKLRMPDRRADDWGRTGLCVPGS